MEAVRDCAMHLLCRTTFPNTYEWLEAAKAIAIAYHEAGAPQEEATRDFKRWGHASRPGSEANLVSLMNWAYGPENPHLSCGSSRLVKRMGWCIGPTCEWQEERKRQRQAAAWRHWKNRLLLQERTGAVLAATYEALMAEARVLGVLNGYPVYVGSHVIAERVRKLLGYSSRGAQRHIEHRSNVRRWTQRLEALGLIRVYRTAGRGVANAYVLLPIPYCNFNVPPEGGH